MASIGASLGPLDPPKTLIFHRFFNVFDIGPSSLKSKLTCPTLRHHGLSWGHLGALLGPLGAILGPSWASLGPPWALLGPPWGHHGPSWGLLGATMGPSWGRLGPPWGLLGAVGGHLEAFLGQLGPFWGFLAPSGRLPGPCWVHFGGILCYFGLIFAPFWRSSVVS